MAAPVKPIIGDTKFICFTNFIFLTCFILFLFFLKFHCLIYNRLIIISITDMMIAMPIIDATDVVVVSALVERVPVTRT